MVNIKAHLCPQLRFHILWGEDRIIRMSGNQARSLFTKSNGEFDKAAYEQAVVESD